MYFLLMRYEYSLRKKCNFTETNWKTSAIKVFGKNNILAQTRKVRKLEYSEVITCGITIKMNFFEYICSFSVESRHDLNEYNTWKKCKWCVCVQMAMEIDPQSCLALPLRYAINGNECQHIRGLNEDWTEKATSDFNWEFDMADSSEAKIYCLGHCVFVIGEI